MNSTDNCCTCPAEHTENPKLQKLKMRVQEITQTAIHHEFDRWIDEEKQSSFSEPDLADTGVQCEFNRENASTGKHSSLNDLQQELQGLLGQMRCFELKMRTLQMPELDLPKVDNHLILQDAACGFAAAVVPHPVDPSSSMFEKKEKRQDDAALLQGFSQTAEEVRNLEDTFAKRRYPQWIAKVIMPLMEMIKEMPTEPQRTGPLARVVDAKWFELFSMVVILCNGIWIAVQTNMAIDTVGKPLPQWVGLLDSSFTLFYLGEILMKLAVHRLLFFICEGWRWNVLDFILVVLGVVDFALSNEEDSFNPVFLRITRLIRITRVFRMFRLLRFFDELRLLLKCIIGSFLALVWSLVTIFSITMLFAIILVQQVLEFLNSDTGFAMMSTSTVQDLLAAFGSVEHATLSLFKAMSGGNDWDVYFRLLSVTGIVAPAVFLSFMIFIWVAMANIITSLYVDKAMKLAQPDLQELLFNKHKEDIESACELRSLFSSLDTNGNGSLSFDEFMKCMSDYKVRSYFEMRGLAVKDAEMFFHMLSAVSDDAEVDIDTFVGGCMKMKGLALNIDLLSLHYEIRGMNQAQKRTSEQSMREIHKVSATLSQMLAGHYEAWAGRSSSNAKYKLSL